MDEQLLSYLLIAAAVLGALAWLWLVVNAFRAGIGWGLAVLFIPPAALVFIPLRWKFARGPLGVMLLGGVVAVSSLVLNQALSTRDPRVRVVNGEVHITLTRVAVDDYSFLKKHPDTIVLQMANPDVTDETLAQLEGMSALRELDLNDSQVTDEGLAVLANLKKLRDLRLRKTRITDAGFRKHLLGLSGLENLDVTGTKVASKTLREWKAAAKDRERKYLK